MNDKQIVVQIKCEEVITDYGLNQFFIATDGFTSTVFETVYKHQKELNEG